MAQPKKELDIQIGSRVKKAGNLPALRRKNWQKPSMYRYNMFQTWNVGR